MAICSLLSLTITFQSFFQPQPQSSVLLLFLGGLLKILTFPLSNVAIHSPGAKKEPYLVPEDLFSLASSTLLYLQEVQLCSG